MANPRIVYNSVNLDLPEPFDEIRGKGRIPDSTEFRTRGGVEMRHFGHAYEEKEVVIEGMSLDVAAVATFADKWPAFWSWAMQGKPFTVANDSAAVGMIDRFVWTGGAAAGATTLPCSSTSSISAGMKLVVEQAGGGANREIVTVQAPVLANSFDITSPLVYSYVQFDLIHSVDFWKLCVAMVSSDPLIERPWRTFDLVLPFRTYVELV